MDTYKKMRYVSRNIERKIINEIYLVGGECCDK